MWQTLPLENFVAHQLKTKHANSGETLWSRYVNLRADITQNILPWIAANEPSLSDHGLEHIQDVMTNATVLLGLPKEHGDEQSWTMPHGFNAHELLLVVVGCMTHDIGNILGRNRHNQAIHKVAELAGPGWKSFPHNDRLTIESVGRAHSGKASDGSKDTLLELSRQDGFFDKVPVRLHEVASLLRFADELAEGPQRTSAAILALAAREDFDEKFKFEKDSLLFHFYAEATHYNIDQKAGRILMDIDIDLDNEKYPKESGEREEFLRSFLQMIYARALKLNSERAYARHYSAALAHFKETSISLRFNRSGHPIDGLDRQAIISDAKTAFYESLSLEELNPAFQITSVLEEISAEQI